MAAGWGNAVAKTDRFWWVKKQEDIKIKEYVNLPQFRFGIQHYENFEDFRRTYLALRY